MQILVDTHILLWLLFDDERLSKKAKDMIMDPENDIHFSTASIMEIDIKHQKNPKLIPYNAKDISDACIEADLINLPIFNKHIFQMSDLNKKEKAPKHNDPFDLILLSQAKRSYMKFLTHDHMFEYYDEDCIILV